MEGNYFEQLDFVIPVVAYFVYRAIGGDHRDPLTDLDASFSKLPNLLNEKMKHFIALQFLKANQHNVQSFHALKKDKMDAYCGKGGYNLKFHLRDNVIEDLDCFKCTELLTNSTCDSSNVYLQQAYRSKSHRHTSTLEETL